MKSQKTKLWLPNDDLKQEVLLRIPDGAVSIYKQGEFEDLCRGPHVPNTKFYAFLNSLVLQERIWVAMKKEKCLLEFMGTAFADKESLKEYLTIIEEAKNAIIESLEQSLSFLLLMMR